MLVHQAWMGEYPQLPRYQCVYRVQWKEAEWTVAVDAGTRAVVGLWGAVAFVPGLKEQRIENPV